ncbi:hypothetical protein MHYP_G00057680 [Metynnis hypsauchen]
MHVVAGFSCKCYQRQSRTLEYCWVLLVPIVPVPTEMGTRVSDSDSTPPTVRIVHSGHACNVEEERYTERVYTIREGETLELTCLVTGHPRPQIRWTKTAGSVSDRFQDTSVFNETLHIAKILRHQGGRYYCKAENGLGSPAIKSIRVDVYYLASAEMSSVQVRQTSRDPLRFWRSGDWRLSHRPETEKGLGEAFGQ